MDQLFAENGNFCDSEGNIIFLRGVNLGGSSKVPSNPDGTTSLDQALSFAHHKSVSFVGRPFELKEANEHLDRLKKWGFNFLRFIVTWEALEHSGPGKYDYAYIDYITKVIALAEKKGFYIYLDPHQDVWSRFTGGDGAPGWTLELLGIDIEKITKADVAYVHHAQGAKYRKMSWPLNYTKYPCATMFTLFYAGRYFAPDLRVDGKNIQDFLQEAYTKAILKLARSISSFRNVIGLGSMNEPSGGWIGLKNLADFPGMGFGPVWTTSPFQEMYMSEGHSARALLKLMAGFYGVPIASRTMNRDKVSIFKEGSHCVWRSHGVWDMDPNGAPMLLHKDYFRTVRGRTVEFHRDFLIPFAEKFQKSIQSVNKKFMIFVEGDPAEPDLTWEATKKSDANVVNASHWYDASLLLTKRFIPWFGVHVFKRKPVFGSRKIQEAYRDTIATICKMSRDFMGDCPTVIGETGIPMDLNNGHAYKTLDYSILDEAMNRVMDAIEYNLTNLTLWNYTPDHTIELGDHWNGEDLSIYSLDTPASIDPDGGRAVRSFSRPYPRKVKGYPVYLSFDPVHSVCKFYFQQDPGKESSAEIFLPPVHYADGFSVHLNAGSYSWNKKDSLLRVQGEKDASFYTIEISPSKK